eukprot:11699521-Ditylum_brightwellii.AAC.1
MVEGNDSCFGGCGAAAGRLAASLHGYCHTRMASHPRDILLLLIVVFSLLLLLVALFSGVVSDTGPC